MNNSELIAILREARLSVESHRTYLSYADYFLNESVSDVLHSSLEDRIQRIDAAIQELTASTDTCEFCKGRGAVPSKKPWSPKSILGDL